MLTFGANIASFSDSLRSRTTLVIDMLFEVPGLKLGQPKTEDATKKNKEYTAKPLKMKQSVETKPKNQNAVAKPKQKKEHKQASTRTDQNRQPVMTPTSLPSVFKASQKSKLQKKMEEKLMGARFRFLNQKLYESNSHDALEHFKENPEDFKNYHQGFRSQVAHWPVNPVDIFIKQLDRDLNNKRTLEVADMGCGEAKIMAHFEGKPSIKVHSFDLAESRPGVIVADMTKVPLPDASLDIVIFCLSLMNTNFIDAIREARRLLKPGTGILSIAEVESRFTDGPDAFVSAIQGLGFKKTKIDTSNKVFWILEFAVADAKNESVDLDKPLLKPCLYKKR